MRRNKMLITVFIAISFFFFVGGDAPIKTRERINTMPRRSAVKSSLACDQSFVMIGDRCVMFDLLDRTWEEAQYQCQSQKPNADLVIFDSIDFYYKLIQFINDTGLNTHDYWVGGTDKDREGEWKWINGANITMGTPLWAVYGSGSTTYEQEPRSGLLADCGCLDKNRFFYMDDDTCSNRKATICQISTWSKTDSLKIPKM